MLLTPESHKGCKGNCGLIVKEVGDLGIKTTPLEEPVGTALITHWTHYIVASF